MKTAKLLKKLSGWNGDARVYEVDPPLAGNKCVVVSAAVAPFSGPETYIFAADDEGNVSSFSELDGSFRGALDHEAALNAAGYEVAL